MQPTESEVAEARSRVGGPYAWYVLGVLVLVYVFNFIDRQIMSILAEDIKRDLGIGDSEIGFLYGTVFGVFYALFGIPLGRLADMWHRVRLLSIGLALWSGMTALSGMAQNFGQLAAARIGVGVGEASASPVAYSVLSDYFPKEKRATALSIYSSGIYIGGGLSLFIGGLTVERWNNAFPDGGPFGLVGWQAAFMAVGLPGLLLAIWVSTLREPIRGLSEGIVMPSEERPFGKFLNELSSVLPPLTVLHAARHGGRSLAVNLVGLAVAAVFIAGMSHFTGNWPQWLALGLAGYAVFSWSQSLSYRDKPTHKLIWGTPTFLLMVLGFGIVSMTNYAHGFWAAPYAIRTFGVDKAMAGFFLGSGGALGGFLSIIAGGKIADTLRRDNPSGRIIIGFATVLLPIPFILLQFTTSSVTLFYIFAFLASLFNSMWVGVAGATAQDLVLPRMRGAATATFFLGTTVIGLGLGPFLAGRLSELMGNLGHALIAMSAFAPLPLLCFYYVYRNLPAAEATRIDRARAAGEPI
ncbi:MFS transporter [Sandaracinobacter sp. RS1-74]|uniref:spinster family MFS transporter n=1 Tax=Sandaracinobacteroides sayramensis TaxID=2913411 RepID=UPI001EDA8D79|nr:MFS transporter [Sandaracinobacteroides sayramensis]MCG2839443.1 MFS transporter [Sandaracinobacteroides sayramensis]